MHMSFTVMPMFKGHSNAHAPAPSYSTALMQGAGGDIMHAAQIHVVEVLLLLSAELQQNLENKTL
jgi:hypothetical protein